MIEFKSVGTCDFCGEAIVVGGGVVCGECWSRAHAGQASAMADRDDTRARNRELLGLLDNVLQGLADIARLHPEAMGPAGALSEQIRRVVRG